MRTIRIEGHKIKTQPNSLRRIKLLDEAPSKVDSFSGGAHMALASAIANLVETEPGGRVIGLEGTWGSGKSTTIALIEDVLDHAP